MTIKAIFALILLFFLGIGLVFAVLGALAVFALGFLLSIAFGALVILLRLPPVLLVLAVLMGWFFGLKYWRKARESRVRVDAQVVVARTS